MFLTWIIHIFHHREHRDHGEKQNIYNNIFFKMNIFAFSIIDFFFLCALCVLCGENDFYELIGLNET